MSALHIPGVGDLNYEVEGQGGPAIAFIHGWCSNLRHWDLQAAYFAPRHALVRADRRGMGRSDCPPTEQPSDHANDLARVLDASAVDKAVIVAHAGGGAAAIDFAARYGDRTLALIGVDAFSGIDPPPEFYRQYASDIRADPRELARRYRMYFGPCADPALRDAVVASAAATPVDVACAELEGLADAPTASQLADVRAPVLWIMARPMHFELLGGLFPDFTPAVTVGAGHYIQLEVPQQLNSMIETFVGQRVRR
jgi:pimeloyl-ACP methyl ester carboxylesterase